MAMGSTSRVVINDEMQKAKAECATFRSEVKTFMQDLDSTVSTLLTGFQGEAANGFKEFYDNNVVAFMSDGGVFDQYLAMFDKEGEGLFDSIEKTLIGNKDGLDPSLGESNRNLGKSDEQAQQ